MTDSPKDKLVNTLKRMGYEDGVTIFQQGEMGKEITYPNKFFTFFNIDTPDDGFYDNEPTKAIWSFYLFFYSNDPLEVKTELERATKELKTEGWIIGSRKGYDAPSDVETHTGRRTTIYFIEREEIQYEI